MRSAFPFRTGFSVWFGSVNFLHSRLYEAVRSVLETILIKEMF